MSKADWQFVCYKCGEKTIALNQWAIDPSLSIHLCWPCYDEMCAFCQHTYTYVDSDDRKECHNCGMCLGNV